MAQTLTASRTAAYQNTYPSSPATVSTDMHHHTWHNTTHASHAPANGTNGLQSSRTKQTVSVNGANGAQRPSHSKADFYKNGRPAEVIVIDSASPEPPSGYSNKRKRDASPSASTTVSVGPKRARKSDVSSPTTEPMHKPHSVIYIQDERGVYRAKDVIVPKIEDVRLLSTYMCHGRIRASACMLPTTAFLRDADLR
jgi:hypothetical protein